MPLLVSTELVNQIASIKKHLPGQHDQRKHGKPMKPLVGHAPLPGAQDPRVGKRPNDQESALRHEPHFQRVIVGMRSEEYVTRSKKLFTRKIPTYGYIWSDTEKNVTGADLDHARFISSKIGPSADNVRIAKDSNSELQATWTDKSGKLQPLYSVAHNIRSNVSKYLRLAQFEAARPKFIDQINKDIYSKDVKTKECARALYLIDKTSFMPGEDEEADRDKRPTYGATTLRVGHVGFERQEANNRDATKFNFSAKFGRFIVRSVPENQLSAIMKDQVDSRKPSDKVFNHIKSEDVALYMKKITGDFTPKDIRGYNATLKALKLVKRQDYLCKTEDEFKIKQRRVGELVGKMLGVAPRTALRDYIDPQVWNYWRPNHWGPWVPPGLRVAHG